MNRCKYCILVGLLMSAVLFSCRPDELQVGDYIKYVENTDNGLKREVSINGWSYDFQYKPHAYIASLEQREHYSDSVYNKRLKQLTGTVWFNIDISKEGSNNSPLRYNLTSAEEYNARYNYFLNQAANDIWLVYGKDTLRPISYLFETSYNLAPKETIVVGFSLPSGDSVPVEAMHLSFYDRIFKNGIIKAGFDKSRIENTPQLIKSNS